MSSLASASSLRYRDGVRAAVAVAATVWFFGASFGLVARAAGMGVLAPLVMSATTFAGSAQFAVASILGGSGAALAAIAAAVLLLVNLLLGRLAPRSRALSSILKGHATLLINRGVIQQAHCQKEGVTTEDLMAALREHGIAHLAEDVQVGQGRLHHGHPQHAAEAVQPRDFPERCMRHLFGVRDGDWLAMLGQPERFEIFDRLGEIRLERCIGSRMGRRERGEMEGAIEEAEDCRGEPAEQPFGAACDRFEHRRRVRRRTGDDLEDFGGGGLTILRGTQLGL